MVRRRSQKSAKPKQGVVQDASRDTLCARCRAMDIKSLFRGERTSYGLGLLTDVTRKRSCTLCRFLTEALETDVGSLPESIWDSDAEAMIPTRCKCITETISDSHKVKGDETVKYQLRFQTNGSSPFQSRPIQILNSNPVGGALHC